MITVLSSLTDTTVITAAAPITTLGVPGPQGPKGDIGDAIVTQTAEAGANLSALRAIRVANGLAYVCDGTDSSHAGRCIGINTGAALLGDDVTIQTAGLLTEPTWTLADGPVFVGANGTLTQSLVGLAFVHQIGIATSPTSIDINPQLPILI